MPYFLNRFLTDRSGNIAMMFALLMFVMLTSAGLALDYQRVATIRTDIQESADASLLAAVRMKMDRPSMSLEEVQTTARTFFEANRRSRDDVSYSAFKVTFDNATSKYSLTADIKIKMSLLKTVGFDDVTPRVQSEVSLGKAAYLEIVMVLDNTGSMNQLGKLGDLKTAANSLVTKLFSNEDAIFKIGLVPFAQYVSVGADKAGAAWMDAISPGASFKGCVGSRDYPANTHDDSYDVKPIPSVGGAPCPNDVLALTDVQTDIENAINAMSGSGYTYIPAGLVWGWRLISSAIPFDEGLSYDDAKERGAFKSIILMTDGKNTRSPDYPTHDASSVINANQLTIEICDGIKAKQIKLYTIAFAVSDTDIKLLLQDCGTSPSHYFEPETAEELVAAFDSIANSLRSLALSK